MNVGDRVRTIPEWTSKWGVKPLFGQIRKIADRGPSPLHPERTVLVGLAPDSRAELGGNHSSLWLDPADLELVD